MAEKITKDMLQSGSILLSIKKKVLSDGSDENYMSLLLCLRDSTLYVPLTMKMSSRDEEKFKNAKEGDEVECEDEVHLSPDIFKAEGGIMLFPIFSQKEQIPQEYAENFSVMPFGITECLQMAHSVEGVEGLVLDVFSEPLPISLQMADMIENLPSMINE